MLLEYSLLDFDLATGRYHMNDLVRSHALHKALAADARVVEVLRERFVQYFLGQLSTCRALLVQQPGPATANPSRSVPRCSSHASDTTLTPAPSSSARAPPSARAHSRGSLPRRSRPSRAA